MNDDQIEGSPVDVGTAATGTARVEPGKVAEEFIVTVEGPGLRFTRGIPEAQLPQLMALLIGGAAPLAFGVAASFAGRPISIGAAPAGPGDDNAPERPMALAEFYHEVAPAKYPEKLVTLGAYLQRILKRHSFTPDELKGMFRQVAEPAPTNLPRDLKTAVGSGWLAREDDGSLYITNTGFKALDSHFTVERKRAPTRARRRRAITVGENEQNGEEEVSE